MDGWISWWMGGWVNEWMGGWVMDRVKIQWHITVGFLERVVMFKGYL